MSYLMEFERCTRDAKFKTHILPRFRLRWRNTRGTITVDSRSSDSAIMVYYPRYAKLGKLLLANNEFERVFIARAVRKALSIYEGAHVCFISF